MFGGFANGKTKADEVEKKMEAQPLIDTLHLTMASKAKRKISTVKCTKEEISKADLMFLFVFVR